jgi:hypothetical protein
MVALSSVSHAAKPSSSSLCRMRRPILQRGRVLPSSKMSVVPLIALGTMASHQLRQRADGRADDPTAVLQEV